MPRATSCTSDLARRVTSVLFDHGSYFGDTIYLFADPSRPITEQAEDMAGKVCSLIGLGLLHSSVPFLVRAGIAAGHLHERVAKGDGTLNVIRIGTAMVKAH